MTNNKTCYLCFGELFTRRKGIVRDNPNLKVLECQKCGLTSLSSFSHIDDKFYRDSKMHNSGKEIEVWLKETSADDERRFKTFKNFIKNKSVLDFGCGAGGFLKHAKTTASRIQGVELESRLKAHFKKERIPLATKLETLKQTFDVITLFHVLEHVPDPISLLTNLSKKLTKTGSIIVEVPNANDALLSLYNSKEFSRFTYWSCHLFYFSSLTLEKIAKKSGLKVNYIKQVQRYPLSNHLHWLSKGKPGGHKIWNFFNDSKLNEIYESKLRNIDGCDTLLASFSKTG